MNEPYTQSILIAATPERIFRHFTDPCAIVAWMGDAAEVEPHAGGRFALRFDDRTVEGRYIVVEPPKRLVISWGRRGSPGFPPGVSTLEVDIAPEPDGTRVTIIHHGLPSQEKPRHADGWEHYLGRLSTVASGLPVESHTVPSHLTAGMDDLTI